ncbi:MAG: ankyrin repeat domain-containing protein [Gammaproteobacteria bacterium]
MRNRSTPEFMKTAYELLNSCTRYGNDQNFNAFEAYLRSRDITPDHLNMKFSGHTLLICAARKGLVKAVRLLLGYEGIDCNIQDGAGMTALMHAAKKGYDMTVELLLKAGAKPDIKDTIGNTALHMASGRRYSDFAALHLLEAKAAPNIQNSSGLTALDHACRSAEYGNTKVLRAMSLLPVFHNCSNHQEFMFFYAACAEGDEKLAKDLITKLNVKNNLNTMVFGMPILHYAVLNGHRTIVRLLITHGVDVNDQRACYKYTALMRATHKGYLDISKDLIDAGAQLELRNEGGDTALDIAVECTNSNYPMTLPVMNVLLRSGAVIHNPRRLYEVLKKCDQRDPDVQNALYLLCKQTNAELQLAITDKSAKDREHKQTELTKKIEFMQKVDAHRMRLNALSMFHRREVHNAICDSLTMMSRNVCGIVTGYVSDGNLFHLENFKPEDICQQFQKMHNSPR